MNEGKTGNRFNVLSLSLLRAHQAAKKGTYCCSDIFEARSVTHAVATARGDDWKHVIVSRKGNKTVNNPSCTKTVNWTDHHTLGCTRTGVLITAFNFPQQRCVYENAAKPRAMGGQIPGLFCACRKIVPTAVSDRFLCYIPTLTSAILQNDLGTPSYPASLAPHHVNLKYPCYFSHYKRSVTISRDSAWLKRM